MKIKLAAKVAWEGIKRRLNPLKATRAFAIGLIYLITVSFIPQVDEKASMTVEVSNIQSDRGQIILGVFNDAEGFPSNNEGMLTHKIKKLRGSSKISISINGLQPGQYAFSVLHDENSNFKIDRNFIGYPTEPYALSRNYEPLLSKPNFSDCVITLKAGANTFSVKLIN